MKENRMEYHLLCIWSFQLQYLYTILCYLHTSSLARWLTSDNQLHDGGKMNNISSCKFYSVDPLSFSHAQKCMEALKCHHNAKLH